MLQRCIALFHKGESQHRIAEPGEKGQATNLYSPITTPLSQMGDFGIGYGLYFSTIRSIAILSFILGIINIPTMAYFASDTYSGPKPEVPGFRRASAICTDQDWVPCPNCTPEQFQTFQAYPTSRTIVHTLGYNFTPQVGGNWLNVTGFTVVEDDGSVAVAEDFAFDTFGDVSVSPRVECSYSTGNCFAQVTALNLTGDSAADPVTGMFALRNNCDGGTRRQGFVNYASLFALIVGALMIYIKNNRLEVQFDEDEQTAQDYSILVKNPPEDAYDPEEWKKFFEDNFDARVAVVTVDVENDDLIQTLALRREILRKIEFILPPGYTTGTRAELDEVSAKVKKERGIIGRFKARMGSQGVPELLNRYDEAAKKVEELSATNHLVSAVFVTFETEAGQRRVLKGLDIGKLAKKAKYLFRGNHILHVEEPEEPSTIRWQEQGTSEATVVRQVVISTISSMFAIFVAIVIIQICYSALPPLGGIMTTVATVLYPVFARIFTKRESHASETEVQKWLYIKIVLFNVAITSLYLQIATPFTATLDKQEGAVPGLITNVHRLFFSQLLLSPVLQLADIMGHIKRHLLAPRAKTQAAMNNLMKGQDVDLSIRYGNMTKFVFLMVWYCAIYPAAFFMGAFALFIAYFIDRFCLMRTWGHAPRVGTHLASFARNYVFPIGFVVMAVISSYAWSGFPYDNLCPDPEPYNTDLYAGDWSLVIEGTTTVALGYTIWDVPDSIQNFSISENSNSYRFCNQDLRTNRWQSFPALPKLQRSGFEWMTENQERVTEIYGWTTVAIVSIVGLSLLFRLAEWGLSYFIGVYRPRGRDMKLSYSEITTIDAYIPQVKSAVYE